ncbi:MAG: hypothetical protein L0G82_17835, partial [Pseudomonas sp.]|nr:hypothetical protein [Pseudomonas sp.]
MGILSEQALTALPSTEFDRWWHSPGEWVEPANQRRGGESGVRLLQHWDTNRPLLFCKRQSGHIYRSLRQAGIVAGDVVAYQLSNHWRCCAIDLAVAALGAIVAPFPP